MKKLEQSSALERGIEIVLNPETVEILRVLDQYGRMVLDELVLVTNVSESEMLEILNFLCSVGVVRRSDDEYSLTDRGYVVLSLLDEIIVILTDNES